MSLVSICKQRSQEDTLQHKAIPLFDFVILSTSANSDVTICSKPVKPLTFFFIIIS